eukprot:220057_1
MAAYGVDTEEGVSSTQTVNSDSEIAKWLKAQNLQKLIPLFAQEDMTLDELIEFADDEVNFKQYLKELNVPKASVFRILSKIKKTKQSKSPSASNDAVSNPNAVVVITQKEQDAMDSLSKRNENINALMQRLAEQDEKVSQNEQSVQSTINEEYTHLIDLIQKSQDTALKTLRGIAKQKKSEISTRLQQLEAHQNNTKNAMKSCNGFVYNVNMERTQRQTQILSTVDGVMKQDIPQNIGDVPTDITLVFQKESIASFVSNLVSVYGEEPHPIPVFDEIKCESITQESCTVRWIAALSAQDLNKKCKSKLFMKIKNVNEDMDEKEREPLDSEMIVFDANNKQYQYKMSDLKRNRLYKMKIALFEGKDNDNDDVEERTGNQSLSFCFKTLTLDFNEKAFVYEHDYDTNGIVYFLGTNFGEEQWENPSERGLIALNSLSGWNAGSVNDMVGRTCNQSWSYHKTENNWITIDFGEKLKVKPTGYTLQYSNNEGACEWYLRNWNLEGSNDGSDWTVIKHHKNDETFTKTNESHTWTWSDCNTYYQQFRIKMTGKNAEGRWIIAYTALEIYGYLTGNK